MAPVQKPAQHDNAGSDGEACRINHEEHGWYDRAQVCRRCCRVMQVSRDTLGTAHHKLAAKTRVSDQTPPAPSLTPLSAPFTEPPADRRHGRRNSPKAQISPSPSDGPPLLSPSASPPLFCGIPFGSGVAWAVVVVGGGA